MRKFVFLSLLLLFINCVSAQNKFAVVKNPKNDTGLHSNRVTKIQIGIGGIISSLNFFKNAQVKTYYPGLTARLYYQPLKFLRFLVDYTQIQPVTITPTWLNVHNTYLDIDMNLLFNFADTKFFGYFILGASSQRWNGFYTGINDFNPQNKKIVPNTNYKTTYYGGNIGLGAEYQILRRLDIYIEMRFRVTDTDVGFGLSDVCYGGGIKYAIIDRYPGKIYKNPKKHLHWF
ncbi:MAG: hypothetical protein ABI448_15505 [Bacteroidia bacterium]